MCSVWQGAGQLWDAVAAAGEEVLGEDEHDRSWSADQVQRRARRIMFAQLLPYLAALPAEREEWIEALPAETRSTMLLGAEPRGRVDWLSTAARGWPPRTLISRRRSRHSNTVLENALAWAIRSAQDLLDAVEPVRRQLTGPTDPSESGAPAPADGPLNARAFQALDALVSLEDIVPSWDDTRTLDGGDVRALAAAGDPWQVLGRYADEVNELEELTPYELALRLLLPDPTMRGPLFHLAVCGEILFGLRELGCSITSAHPIGSRRETKGPAFDIRHAGQPWQLWFEGAGLWSRSGETQPYKDATGALLGERRALSPDLVLTNGTDKLSSRSLIIECKDSASPKYAGRDGYHQATTYLAESHGRLSSHTVSVVVGTSETVRGISLTELVGGHVGLVAADTIGEIAKRFIADQRLT